MDASTAIMVSGANGQLGQELQRRASLTPGSRFIFLSRGDLPVEDTDRILELFNRYQPAFFINCAAYTAVDKAESEPELAFRINAEAVGNIAAICKEYKTRLIHISTDYVFDGKASSPYAEDAPVEPQSVYGASKLAGERLALNNDPSCMIIRTSWVYSEFGKNFVKTMLRLMKEKEQLNVVNDQLGCPTYAADLAQTIIEIIESGEWKPGIFHYCNKGVISWYDFAVKIRDLSGSSCIINPIPTSGYPTPAKRPAYSALDNSKIRQAYHLEQTHWEDSLAKCLHRLKE